MKTFIVALLVLVATSSFGELYLGNAPLLTHSTAIMTGVGADQTARYLISPMTDGFSLDPTVKNIAVFCVVPPLLANLSCYTNDPATKHILKDGGTASTYDNSIRIMDGIIGKMSRKPGQSMYKATKAQWIYRGVVTIGIGLAVRTNIHNVKN